VQLVAIGKRKEKGKIAASNCGTDFAQIVLIIILLLDFLIYVIFCTIFQRNRDTAVL